MTSDRTEKRIAIFQKGWITPHEFAIAWLADAVAEAAQNDKAFVLSIYSLPEELKRGILLLLREIKQNDFHWLVPVIDGPQPPRPEPPEQAEKLRQICSLLAESLNDPLLVSNEVSSRTDKKSIERKGNEGTGKTIICTICGQPVRAFTKPGGVLVCDCPGKEFADKDIGRLLNSGELGLRDQGRK